MKITLTYSSDDILRLCQDNAKSLYPDKSCRPWIEGCESPEVIVEVTSKGD